MRKSYFVIFRVGGYRRYQWRAMFDPFTSREAAEAERAKLELAGYPALVSDRRDLPETYTAEDSVEGVTRRADGWLCQARAA